MVDYYSVERLTICDEDVSHGLRAIDMDAELSKKTARGSLIVKETSKYVRAYVPADYAPDFDAEEKYLICNENVEVNDEIVKAKEKTLGGDKVLMVKVQP